MILKRLFRVIHLVSSIGFPSGVIASIMGDELKISGTLSEETPEHLIIQL